MKSAISPSGTNFSTSRFFARNAALRNRLMNQAMIGLTVAYITMPSTPTMNMRQCGRA